MLKTLKKRHFLLFVLLALFLTIATAWWLAPSQERTVEEADVFRIQVGMTVQEVKSILGEPITWATLDSQFRFGPDTVVVGFEPNDAGELIVGNNHGIFGKQVMVYRVRLTARQRLWIMFGL